MLLLWRRAGGLATVVAFLVIGALPVAAQSADHDGYDVPPKLLKQTKPTYPSGPFYNRVEGTVDIEFVVDENGHVTEPKVVKSIPGLDKAALDCVKKWKFTPAQKEGTPVKATARAPITFRIVAKKD